MGYHALTNPCCSSPPATFTSPAIPLSSAHRSGHGEAAAGSPCCALGLAAVAATGLPPFGLFFSELTVISGGVAAGQMTISVLAPRGRLIGVFLRHC